jgi:hypothetical protein
MKVFGLGASVLTGAMLLAVPGESHAAARLGIGIFIGHDSRYDRGYGYGERDTYRLGYGRGYQDGFNHGRTDSHHEESYNFWHDKRYRCGDAGYQRHYGPKGVYVNGYREGYEQGYRRAYASSRRHDHHGNGYGYDRDRRYDDRNRTYDEDDDRYDRDR